MFQRLGQWMHKVTRAFHRVTAYGPRAWCIRCVLSSSAPLYHWSPGVTGASSRQESRHWWWPHFFSWEMHWSAFLTKWSADGIRQMLLAWILGRWSGPQRMLPLSVVPSPHPTFVITWRLMVEQLWSGLEANILSRKLREDQWHAQPWESLWAGRLCLQVHLLLGSWAGKWVQLMNLKAHSNEDHYHNDVVN